MPTVFPKWPHILFGIVEPIFLIMGALSPVFDLDGFINGQTPLVPAPESQHPSSVALAYQLGNLYGLLFLIGVAVLHTSTDPKVIRNYLIALAIADVGHVYATYFAMGWEAFVDVGSWNALTWGNVGATGFLFLNRILYFLGLFGQAQAPKAAGKKE